MHKQKYPAIIGLKDLRENVNKYISAVHRGAAFTVVRRSKPIFNITPVDVAEGVWAPVIDLTTIRKGGVNIQEIISRL